MQPVYKPLDLGSIKPLGWFKDQLELEAAGLSGNMFDFYRFVHDSKYIGGSTEYSGLEYGCVYIVSILFDSCAIRLWMRLRLRLLVLVLETYTNSHLSAVKLRRTGSTALSRWLLD